MIRYRYVYILFVTIFFAYLTITRKYFCLYYLLTSPKRMIVNNLKYAFEYTILQHRYIYSYARFNINVSEPNGVKKT